MQPPGNLDSFIAAAKAKGASDDALLALLRSAGWPQREVLAALRRHYETVTGIPLPTRGSSGETSREAFFHLLAFSTLATWTIALGSLLFALIEQSFPDPVTSTRDGYLVQHSVTTEIASLLIAFPIYLLVSRAIVRDSAKRPAGSESGVTRWLTWLALLIAAGIVIGDLIAFVAWLLRGELTVRFILKALVVGMLAGGVFWYYLGSLGATWRPAHQAFAATAALAVVAAIVGGFLVTGSPARQRSLNADRRRVEDLRRFVQQAHARWAGTSTLPAALPPELRDPATGAAYEYRVRAGPEYEVCAAFESDGGSEFPDGRWRHPAGRHCYTFDARIAP